MLEPKPRSRGVFCNRTLNLRSIRAIGYDMDYTLVDYRAEAWELRAYEYTRRRLMDEGWPVAHFAFEPEMVARGLIIDTEQGNLLKANRFGYVKKAYHGTRALEFDEQRRVYSRTMVELSNERWVFLNTLFSLSEACLYSQLVELLDARALPGVHSYATLFKKIRNVLDTAHMEGALKAEIVANPERYVLIDPETAEALMDQRDSGKRLMLITNSDWAYTRSMMSYAFDRFMPKGQSWRALFDVLLVEARKPDFFLRKMPLYEVVSDDGLLRPAMMGLREGGIYYGGHAGLVEHYLGLSGDELLYVGDHMWGDVRVSKSVLRWRTALILRELEQELEALERFAPRQRALDGLMAKKERLEAALCQARLRLQRLRHGRGDGAPHAHLELEQESSRLRAELQALDEAITPLALEANCVGHARWGTLMRTGNDKSHLARQVESYADIYTSRVSNLLYSTPSAFFRSPKGRLPHDEEGLAAASETS